MNPEYESPRVTEIALSALAAHPLNSNVMKPALLDKLADHIARTDRYPPIIVRPLPGSGSSYQLLDGHHRVAALRRLRRSTARCDVWDVGDDEALVLLATLNRLEGDDDPRKRGRLLAELRERGDWPTVATGLPEAGARLEALCALNREAPAPAAPRALNTMPVAVHFFVLPDQRRALEARLRAIGGTREDALMRLVHGDNPGPSLPSTA